MTDKRVEKNSQNVINIHTMLLDICINYKDYNEENLLLALSSQNGLSKYENEELGIFKSSLNTLKRTAGKIFPNGFEEIDRLRILALDKISKNETNSISRNTKDYYKEKYEALLEEVEKQNQVNLVATHELMQSLNAFKNIRNINDINLVHNLCDKQIKRLQANALNYTEFASLKKETSLQLIKGGKNE